MTELQTSKAYAKATAGSTDEHTYIAPDLFTAETPLGSYQGITDQIVMSRTPGSFRTVLCREARANPNGYSTGREFAEAMNGVESNGGGLGLAYARDMINAA